MFCHVSLYVDDLAVSCLVILFFIEKIKDRRSKLRPKAILVGDKGSGRTLLMNNVGSAMWIPYGLDCRSPQQ